MPLLEHLFKGGEMHCPGMQAALSRNADVVSGLKRGLASGSSLGVDQVYDAS